MIDKRDFDNVIKAIEYGLTPLIEKRVRQVVAAELLPAIEHFVGNWVKEAIEKQLPDIVKGGIEVKLARQGPNV